MESVQNFDFQSSMAGLLVWFESLGVTEWITANALMGVGVASALAFVFFIMWVSSTMSRSRLRAKLDHVQSEATAQRNANTNAIRGLEQSLSETKDLYRAVASEPERALYLVNALRDMRDLTDEMRTIAATSIGRAPAEIEEIDPFGSREEAQ